MGVFFGEDIEAVEYTFVQNKMSITKTAGTPYTIQADIQPETGDDEAYTFVSSPQGRKSIGLVKVFTDTALTVSKEGQTLTGTVLSWEGEKWEVIQELDYHKNSFFTLVDHFKYVAQLLTPGELV